MTDLLYPADIDNAVDLIIKPAREIIPTETNRQLVTEWTEQNRIIPQGLSPYPGPFSFDVNPFMREIVDCLSESSPVKEVAVMKGTQITYTVAVIENWLGYIIGVSPGPTGYVQGNQDLAETQMELRIDSVINHCGLSEKIASQHKRKTQRKTGDIKTRKEFPGGFILAGGPRSGFIKRSMSLKYIAVDEIDMFKDDIDSEGDPIYLIRKRVGAFSENYKILWGSSPQYDHNSKIKQLFLEGDQRRYFVPCKHCKEMQYLKWSQVKFEHDDDDRLICELDKDGKIKSSSVYCECEKCGGHWTNADKDFFLPRGEWRPTAVPRRPGMRSYHIPSLYSPVGFGNWEDGVIEFLQIKHEGFPKLKMQNWVNTFLGEPFVDQGEKPRLEAILTRERNYHIGTLPEKVKPLFLTLSADVQANRIECEVVAWLRNKISYSINYFILPGDTADIDSSAWTALREIIRREHAGHKISLVAVDSGYRTDVVYQFCDSFDRGVFPIMGSDEPVKSNKYIKIIPGKDGRIVPRIDINTDVLKQEIYAYLNKSVYESGLVPNGYCYFPFEYSREHYNRLTAESRVFDASRKRYTWDAGNRRNEQLDCRVYNLAMVYTYRQIIEDELLANDEIEKEYNLSWDDFWNYIERLV